jgi:hypothetical protein
MPEQVKRAGSRRAPEGLPGWDGLTAATSKVGDWLAARKRSTAARMGRMRCMTNGIGEAWRIRAQFRLRRVLLNCSTAQPA